MMRKNPNLRRTALWTIRVLAVVVLIGAAGCKGAKVQSHWIDQPVTVDGATDDWSGVAPVISEQDLYSISLSNDGERLNILLVFTNIEWVRAIRADGLTFYFDATAKKSKDVSLCYRGGPTLDMLRNMGAVRRSDSLDIKQLELEARYPELQRDGFTLVDQKNDMERALPVDGSRGPAAAFDIQGGVFTYEFSIPFQRVDKFSYGIGSGFSPEIIIGMKWAEPSKEDLDRMKRDPEQRLPDDIGQRSGGRDPMARAAANPALFQKQEIWLTVALPSGQSSGN